MREIKFRAWENELNRNRMFAWEEIKKDFESWLNDSATYVMQYTGLKDKNGTEIYEGDILKHEKYNSMGVMEWDIENGCWTKFYPLCFFEVIGNIHQNPELL